MLSKCVLRSPDKSNDSIVWRLYERGSGVVDGVNRVEVDGVGSFDGGYELPWLLAV